MYRHILVPLDGSALAEQVLPHVQALVSENQSPTRITLLRAVPPLYPLTVDYSGTFATLNELLPELEEEARAYLEGIAEPFRAEGCTVLTRVLTMPAADAILEYAEEHGVNLIVIATHGRSGINRWIFGSVTQKVIQHTPVPILVIRPSEDEKVGY